jgi:hypothetical protein
MQLIDRNTDTTHVLLGNEPVSPRRAGPGAATTSQRLWVTVGAGALVIAGPPVLGTLAQATLASAEVLLEISRVALVAYQMFGR